VIIDEAIGTQGQGSNMSVKQKEVDGQLNETEPGKTVEKI